MSETSEKIKELAISSFNLEGFAYGLIDEILEPSLQKIVDDSTNNYDNMAMAALYPTLEEKIKEEIKKALEKLYA